MVVLERLVGCFGGHCEAILNMVHCLGEFFFSQCSLTAAIALLVNRIVIGSSPSLNVDVGSDP